MEKPAIRINNRIFAHKIKTQQNDKRKISTI